MEWMIGIGVFFATVCIIEGIVFLFRHKWDPESNNLEKRLEKFYRKNFKRTSGVIVKKRNLSDLPKFHAFLAKIPVMHRLDKLVLEADSKIPLGVHLLATAVFALVGYTLLSIYARDQLFPLLAGMALATVPFLYLILRKRRRVKRFQAQLPDALDLMARSLRAGHAFSGGLNMVAREFDDPIGSEFLQCVSEINFGASTDQALRNMAERVDVPDLKFFTVSVIVQKETGGNLADILENIARLIRERFMVIGKIRALSAEGKLTAAILVALPVLVFSVLSFMNPAYIHVLTQDATGRFFTLVALVMMGAGIIIIKKLISIKV